jgi:quercetin dioxygenase-like cupin family protein
MRGLVGLPTSRRKVERLEAVLRARGEPVDLPLQNFFAPGVFVGTMLIRKGYVLTGAVHKVKHIAIVAKGRIVIEGDGGQKELVAGDVIVSEPGAKRAGVALEDTLFINVFANPTDETDYPTLVEMFTESKFGDLIESVRPTLGMTRPKEIPHVPN